jgi:hypothetical protein
MITVRDARPGDGAALARIHGQMATYYATLAPDLFHAPDLAGFPEEIDAALASADADARHLVAEVDAAMASARGWSSTARPTRRCVG